MIWFHVSFDEKTVYLISARRSLPTEANRGPEFWGEIVHRDLFDADLAIKIASATEGLYCWPEDK